MNFERWEPRWTAAELAQKIVANDLFSESQYQKIEQIKLLRRLTECGLKDAKDMIDAELARKLQREHEALFWRVSAKLNVGVYGVNFTAELIAALKVVDSAL